MTSFGVAHYGEYGRKQSSGQNPIKIVHLGLSRLGSDASSVSAFGMCLASHVIQPEYDLSINVSVTDTRPILGIRCWQAENGR